MKPVLAVETSGILCSVSVYFDDNRFYESNILEKHSHSEKLFEAVDQTLASAKISLKDLEGIAVSSGPGSFTGLRIGLSAVKGLAMGANLPVALIPTFDALALQISSYLPDNTKFVIANSVNVEEAYYGKFQVKANNYIFVEILQIIKKAELSSKTKDSLVFGNAAHGKEIRISAPNASFVGKWCKDFGNELFTLDYDYLEPHYLKNFIIKERKK